MRPRPGWMSLKDGLILELLGENQLELPPKAIYRNLVRREHEIGYSTVRLRVKELEDHGLLNHLEDGYYEVSDLGHLWLEGEIGSEELEEDN